MTHCPHNNIDCPCPKDCPRHGKCCACVAHHKEHGTKLPKSGPKSFGLAEVLWNGNVFIHKAVSTYFEENGVRAAYAREQGKVWDGPESIDDYC